MSKSGRTKQRWKEWKERSRDSQSSWQSLIYPSKTHRPCTNTWNALSLDASLGIFMNIRSKKKLKVRLSQRNGLKQNSVQDVLTFVCNNHKVEGRSRDKENFNTPRRWYEKSDSEMRLFEILGNGKTKTKGRKNTMNLWVIAEMQVEKYNGRRMSMNGNCCFISLASPTWQGWRSVCTLITKG